MATPTASSSGSYSDLDLRDLMQWQVEVMKIFKVSELDELLNKKGKIVKGRKEQKAMEVAWCYTKEEIATWRRQRQDLEPPALLANRERATTLDEFFKKG